MRISIGFGFDDFIRSLSDKYCTNYCVNWEKKQDLLFDESMSRVYIGKKCDYLMLSFPRPHCL